MYFCPFAYFSKVQIRTQEEWGIKREKEREREREREIKRERGREGEIY